MSAFSALDSSAPTAEVGRPGLAAQIAAVAAVAAEHAGAVDRDARFPAEAVAAIKAQRLLSIMVPARLGGEGLGIGEASDVCFRLGQACGSSGMIYAMHNIKVACLVRHRRGNEALEGLLRRLSAEQLLLASSTTEGQRGGNVRSSEAAVERVDGRIRLERRATVISYGAYADGIVTTARRSADADARDQILVAFLKSDYTLEPLQGWSTLGMRGTCSEGYVVRATGAADQVLPDPYQVIHEQTVVPFAHLLWGSVWAGIAASAVARAQAFMRQAMRQRQEGPPGKQHFALAMASLRTLRGVLSSAMRAYVAIQDDPQALASIDFQTMITLTKIEASELAVSAVMSALRACGLSGYRADGDFSVERQLRDVLSAPLMIHNDRILANLATTGLVAPLPESAHD